MNLTDYKIIKDFKNREIRQFLINDYYTDTKELQQKNLIFALFLRYYFNDTYIYKFSKTTSKHISFLIKYSESNEVIMIKGGRRTLKSVISNHFVIFMLLRDDFKFGIIASNIVEKASSKLAILRNILSSNRKLKEDFGTGKRKQIIPESKSISNDTSKKIDKATKIDLINGIQLLAIGLTGGNVRDLNLSYKGQLVRPDFVWIDDIETRAILAEYNLSKSNKSIKIIKTIKELFGSMELKDKKLITLNHLTNDGVTSALIDELSPRLFTISIVNDKGEINFPDIYKLTKEEADIENQKKERLHKPFSSIQRLKEEFGDDFEAEANARPDNLDPLITVPTEFITPPIENFLGANIYFTPGEEDFLIIGADVSQGIGRHHSAIAIVVQGRENEVCADYFDNNISPSDLAKLMIDLGNHLSPESNYILAPESNNIGILTIFALQQYDEGKFANHIYKNKVLGKKDLKDSQILGFQANSASVKNIYQDIRKRQSELQLASKYLVDDLKSMSKTNFYSKNVTNHNDLARAYGIARLVSYQTTNHIYIA